ncbi:sensor histidine kinase [Labilibacter marinus]|uniref:sensor histidine kinase n=1 Tax=Labilibacter marinus TaxID=1477105 RepID=UPI000831DDDA|nr:histidine kinase [Labilibacter marinus]
MDKKLKFAGISLYEIVFQIILNILAFIFFAFDKKNPQIEIHHVAFYLNYAIVALLINYVIFPRFYYKKKYFISISSIVLITTAAIILEEFVLEKIFFPDTRGREFAGIFYTLLGGMPVITMLSGFKFAWDALMKQKEVEDLKAVAKESELRFLKSQINPHFLFNNLNNLYAYAIENSPKTPEIILELSSVLRYMLYECKEKYVPLQKEIDLIENYIRLHQLQIEDRGHIQFTQKNISGSYHIAPLILIVFIENAYKHSTASQTENIYIEVNTQLSDDGILSFYCKNSFQEQSNTEKLPNGIGLINVKKRLQLLYPKLHSLEINKDESFFEVQLSITLTKQL